MNEPKPGGPLDVPGVESRTSGLRGQTRLLIIGAVILVMVVIGILHPTDKPLMPDQSVLRPGDGGGLVLSNGKLTLPVPAAWVLSQQQKPDELHLRNAGDTCRILIMRTNLNTTPESFQEGMSKRMTDDGNTTTPQPPVVLGGRQAAQMHAQLGSGATEDIYTVHAGSSMYTLVLVNTPGCKEDLRPLAQGFHIDT